MDIFTKLVFAMILLFLAIYLHLNEIENTVSKNQQYLIRSENREDAERKLMDEFKRREAEKAGKTDRGVYKPGWSH
jgi:predicted Holliday junction resolvase-like endonuclease